MLIIRAYINGFIAKPFCRLAHSPIIGIFGDSTGVGAGASSPQKSLAGLIGNHYPNATIINKSIHGKKIKKTAKILEKHGNFDLIIICCVGIDILFLRNNNQIKKDLQKLFFIASQKSKNIFYITPLNVSLSTAIPRFLKKYYFNKSKQVGLIIEAESKNYPNITVINNLLIDNSDIPDYNTISCSDRVHPNDLGYLWIYNKIKSKLPNH